MVERAVAPSICGATGTSRQPRTVRPSSPAMVSMRATASSVPSAGRKAMPTAYAPASGRSNPATSRKKASGTWERMPAPSPESGSEPVAPRCSRLRSTVSAWSTRVWDASPVRVATKPTPHASCSLRGSYIPCAAGRASMKDQFWPFAECWDGWRGVRIGSPVVVIWHVASAEGRRWPSARYVSRCKIWCRLHDGVVLGKRDNPFQHADTDGVRWGYRTRGGGCGDRNGQIGVRRSGGAEGASSPTPRMHGRLHCPQRLRLMPGDYALETSE